MAELYELTPDEFPPEGLENEDLRLVPVAKPPFSYSVEEGVATVELPDEVDMFSAHLMRSGLLAAAADRRTKELAVVFGETSFDWIALGALAKVWEKVQNPLQKEMSLHNVKQNHPVWKQLESMGLHKLIVDHEAGQAAVRTKPPAPRSGLYLLR